MSLAEIRRQEWFRDMNPDVQALVERLAPNRYYLYNGKRVFISRYTNALTLDVCTLGAVPEKFEGVAPGELSEFLKVLDS